MNEEFTTEEMTAEENPFIIDENDLVTAGLWDPDTYNFRFESMTPVTKEVKNDNDKTGARAGDKYHVITGRLVAFEKAIYDEDGNFDCIEEMDPTPSRFQDFPVKGRGLQLLKSAYRAVTGRVAKGVFNEDSGRYDLDTIALADELVGCTAWNRIFHGKKDEATGNIFDRMTYTFTTNPPQKTYVPKKKDDDDE